ncbi:acyl-CoA dehydrogenase/oxidase [Podospora didyma]|uniref:Acyl-CoA dehydrogenase/oxidase n=1 Tax=Podospora didyma TaxID=330526 RepID=A0AAE0KJF5_9PEZI|nr:acyl-CoA dehydrogenase/oxidase [Podospora didyma]
MEPSSSNTGFIQQLPTIKNQFHDDASLLRVAKLFLPPSVLDHVGPEMEQLGDEVLEQQIFDWVTDAEKNQPYLRGSGRDAFGKPCGGELVVTEGWKKLQDFGFEKGVVAINYDTDYGPYTRLVQFLRCHLWEASCANTLCPAAMQDGAARLLQRHLAKQDSGALTATERRVFQNAFDHLISRDPSKAWTSGQWMTERTGGSDVSQTETVATYDPYPDGSAPPLASANENIPLGPWSISGFKWFSSATDSQMVILLAKTQPGKGVSAFFAPMRRHNPSLVSATGKRGNGTELNGVTIQRLKNKFGTQSLPTAELELKGMRGWLIGEEGKGIQEISTILNITRAHTTVSSMGYLGRGLGIAKAFAVVREVGVGKGKRIPLSQHPLHMRTLSNIAVDYHAMMLLVFYTLSVLGLDERGLLQDARVSPPSSTNTSPRIQPPPQKLVAPLIRIMSSLHKAYVCEHAVPLVFACMEALGGVGYLVNVESEHINVSRLFRDACVGAIWEGTTDVLSSDTLRALKHSSTGPDSLAALEWLISTSLNGASSSSSSSSSSSPSTKAASNIRQEWTCLRNKVTSQTQEQLLPEARQIVFRIAEVLMAALFAVDAATNPGAEIDAMYERYMSKKGFATAGDGGANDKQDPNLDGAIIYGSSFSRAETGRASSKL